MAPNVDSAIVKALSLDLSTTSLTSHGGSNFSSTYKLTSKTEQGDERGYFIKTAKEKDAEVMFAGEHASLNAIHAVEPSLCPKSYAHGALADTSSTYFLATDFLNLSAHSQSSPQHEEGSGLSLAQKLAKLHSTPAPTPEGYDHPVFGFPVPTACGNIIQDNTYMPSWSHFFAHSRLLAVLHAGESKHGPDAQFSRLVTRTVEEVVPALLRDGHLTTPTGENVTPVVVHGDLWSGNRGRGVILDGGKGGDFEEIVFDPSCAYAHSEFEFGIMRMFGGFGRAFEKEYYEAKGERDRPVDEWDDRVKLYELYHHLNHYALFGGSYKNGGTVIMKELLSKYGSQED